MNMRSVGLITVIVLLTGAAGCSDSGEKTALPAQQQKDDVWETQRQPMQKAEAVEQQMLDAAEQRRKEMEQQTQ